MLTLVAMTSPALAGSKAQPRAESEQVAAIPDDATRTAALLPGAGRDARVAALPRPLSAADADTYSRIFALQDQGQWAAADREVGHLHDDVLKGHVLARRYLASGYVPKFPEVKAWMAQYSDLPQAESIYQLANGMGIRGFGAIKQPVHGYLKGTGIDTSDDGANWEWAAFGSERTGAKTLEGRFRALLRHGDRGAAMALLASSEARGVGPVDLDALKLALAIDHFAGGRDEEAARWASEAAERSGDELPVAHWIAGLAEWRMGKPEQARRHFEEVADASDSSSWMVAAGAFWAARANLLSHRPEVVNHWLEIAATYPRTFYGLLARRLLGYETLFSWETTPFTEADADVLMRVPGGRRALALLQIGQRQAAEEELRRAYPQAGKAVRQSMLSLASVGEMPGLALRLGGVAPGQDNDSVQFPIPEWTPRTGWQVDRALVFAFVRQESSFNPHAKSAKGAGGLMQLMPATVQAIGGRHARDHMNDPETNLMLGQHYLAQLLSQDPVNGNLLYLAAAYNAGPGKLAQWINTAGRATNDPLLFIASLPSRETRAFVERVMTSYWIYRSRLGQPSDSLDMIASGQWPMYEGGNPGTLRPIKISGK